MMTPNFSVNFQPKVTILVSFKIQSPLNPKETRLHKILNFIFLLFKKLTESVKFSTFCGSQDGLLHK